MVLMLCLGIAGEVKGQPACFRICPPEAGLGDEVTMTAYDPEGEFFDLSTLDSFESNFHHDTGGYYPSLLCIGSDCENCEYRDGTVVFTLTDEMLQEDVTMWDFFCTPWGDDWAFRIANRDDPEDAPWRTVAEAIANSGTCEGMACPGVRSIDIDPNVMLVYETGETEGDFGVSLLNEPPPEAIITIRVDPNSIARADGPEGGPSEDITLIGGSLVDGSITLTFTGTTATDANSLDLLIASCPDWDPATKTSCWNCPQTVAFKAIDDGIAEPQETGDTLLEPQNILASSSYPPHPTDANFVGEVVVTVNVFDNDQANMLFTYTVPESHSPEMPVTGPVKIWEQPRWQHGWPLKRWREIGVTLQVVPVNDENPGSQEYVRVIVTEGESGNQPIMWLNPEWDYNEPLPPIDEPNAIVFTSDGNPVSSGVIGVVSKWDVSYPILIFGNDDDVLQAEEVFAAGDENYGASLLFFVESTSDERYAPLNDEDEPEGLERSVIIDIEDNECGAFGFLPTDIIGNPSRVSDPNYRDCYVDLYDAIEFATQWLDCSDPQDPACESYL